MLANTRRYVATCPECKKREKFKEFEESAKEEVPILSKSICESSFYFNHLQSDDEDKTGASVSFFYLPLHMFTILCLLFLETLIMVILIISGTKM